MIEPQRLLDDPELTDEARELLHALPRPQEPSAAKTAALAAKLSALAGTPLAPAAPAASATHTALWLKMSLVVGAIGLAGVGLYFWRAPKAVPAAASAPVPQVVSAALPEATPAPAMPASSASADTEPPASAPVTAPAPSTRAPRDTLAAEEALLEQARKAAAASPARALTLLDQYKRQFPHGQLAAERMFLSADVLTRLGNLPAAQHEKDALVRAFPRSVYAAQVKANSAASSP